jgi:hypothetical protein
MFSEETTPGKHVHHDGDNITISKPERGTSLTYTLKRLKREKLDLYRRRI